ncbi:unnamed protein product [Paramecium octaurelia]|uniref:Uncharacterized protein n=1 Tax=Paramecium octaurelia TaxID=43137 RepID=A0A8S1U8G1_PAROT|nr:unnamed protein product [Paramecium octaurelia]
MIKIYKSVRIYMKKIVQDIKSYSFIQKPIDIKHLKDYVSIIKELEKYLRQRSQSIKNCNKLVKLFSQKVFNQFIDFLTSLKQLLDKRFYLQTQKYSKTKNRLQLFIKLIYEKQQDC